MREAKFRGLSGKGEWVTGWLIKDLPGSTVYGHEYPYRICWHPESGGQANCPVKKGTEGQYTGLRDKNGVEIYEGYLIRDHVGVGEVKYSPEHAAYRVCYGDGRAKWFIDYNLPGEKESIEVIGNIYENPELLEPKP